MIKPLITTDIATISNYTKDERFDCCELKDFWTEDELAKWILDSQDVTLGYYLDDQLVGFCLSHSVSNISKVYLENIYVAPQFRGNGISMLLINAMIDQYQKMYPNKTLRYVALVETGNDPAISLLRKGGFNVGDTMYWIQKNT